MADKNIKNPLEELYTDASGQLDQAELATLLRPFLRIHRDTGTIIFTNAGIALPATKKIVLFLLAKKALYLLGSIPSEWITPKQIKVEFGKNIPAGTIDANLKRLSRHGPLKGDSGKYFIPDFNFPQVREIFSKLSGENYGR